MTVEWTAEPATAITRVCDGAMIFLAIFTLLANTAVVLGGGLDALIGATAVCIAASIAWWVWRRTTRSASEGNRAMDLPVEPERDVDQTTRAGLLVGALVAVGVYVATGSLAAFCACGLAVAAGGLARTWQIKPTGVGASTPRMATASLLALSLICALATAVAHRSDSDDSFYVNLVVAAVDHPDAPLLAGDTLHGFADVPMAMPVFRVLSYELLQAGIARLTGISALTLVHVVMPPLIALLIPLAYARLLALLLPGRWLWATFVVVAALLLVGDGTAGQGDFALLRLHQGKSILIHVALPLVSAYGIGFALRPDAWRFALLMASQIAAVGLSSSGLWLAPAVSGIALVGALGWKGRQDAAKWAGTLLVGLSASSHAIVWAAVLRAETRRAFAEAAHPLESLAWSGERLIEHAQSLSLGEGAFALFGLFCLPAALATASNLLFRRLAAVALVAFFGLFFNPLTAPFIANHVSGPDTYFRVFWLIPLPVYLAAVLTAPLEWPLRGRLAGKRVRIAATIVLAGVALLVLPTTHTLSTENGVRIAVPGWKLPPDQIATARLIARYAEPGDVVVAPAAVSRWLPLLHHHPSPLMVREMHLDRLHDLLGPEELERRFLLTHIVGGEPGGHRSAALLAEAIGDYPLEVVCLGGRALSRAELRRVLLDSPLDVRERGPGYEIWARRGTMRE